MTENAGTGPEAITSLEYAAARAWPAPICERLGEWWLRSADGFTGRANSALPLGYPGMPVPDALSEVSGFYRTLGHQPFVDVPLPLRADVATAAATAGWAAQSTVLVQAAAIGDLIERTAAGEFTLHAVPSDDHLAQIANSRGPVSHGAYHVLTAVEPVTFAEYRENGALYSRARGTVTDGWLGLFGIETAPAARRRGLAGAAIGRLARWAREHEATHAFLQVESRNAAAQRLYAKLGFATHHTYTRYAAPAA